MIVDDLTPIGIATALVTLTSAVTLLATRAIQLQKRLAEKRLFAVTGSIDADTIVKIRVTNQSAGALTVRAATIVQFPSTLLSRVFRVVLGLNPRRTTAIRWDCLTLLPITIPINDATEIYGRVLDASLSPDNAAFPHLRARLDLGGRITFHRLKRTSAIVTPHATISKPRPTA